MAFDDPVADNPVWLHLQADLDWGPGRRPKDWADELPDQTGAATLPVGD